MPGQRFEGEGRHEARGARRKQRDDVSALALQEADELWRLVGRDRAGDADCDQAALEATFLAAHPRPSSIGSAPVTSACMIASPRRVSSGSIASTPWTPRAQGAADRPPVRMACTSV